MPESRQQFEKLENDFDRRRVARRSGAGEAEENHRPARRVVGFSDGRKFGQLRQMGQLMVHIVVHLGSTTMYTHVQNSNLSNIH